MSINNRVVVITGATGGLGRVVTKQFANQGARLVLVGTSLERVQSLEDALKLPKEHVLISVADLCQPERATNLVRQTMDKFGRIDVLLHLVGGWVEQDCRRQMANRWVNASTAFVDDISFDQGILPAHKPLGTYSRCFISFLTQRQIWRHAIGKGTETQDD
jgi:NADP-dependent 3-hydroxy acid dehydrogenase YdfG